MPALPLTIRILITPVEINDRNRLELILPFQLPLIYISNNYMFQVAWSSWNSGSTVRSGING